MAYTYPVGSNVFIPDHQSSGSLVLGYSRNINDFVCNRYLQRIPVTKPAFQVLNWKSDQGDRSTNLNASVWAYGADAQSGAGNNEAFQYESISTTRRNYPYTIDSVALSTSDWNLLAAQNAIAAQQCMTERTILSYNTIVSKLNSTTALTLNGAGGYFNKGTPSTPYLKNGLFKAINTITQSTMGVVTSNKMCAILNPNTAYQIGCSQEITDNFKFQAGLNYDLEGSPVPGFNSSFGIPDRLYGVMFYVDVTTKNTAAKGGTQNHTYVIPDGEVLLVSVQGGLQGIEGAPSWSTLQFYAYEEMTNEIMTDVNNRRTQGRVVSNYVVYISDQGKKSGIRITGALG